MRLFSLLLLLWQSAIYAQVPPNDLIANAISITPSPQNQCTPIYGTVQNATESSNLNPSCGPTAGRDVWYSFYATTTRHHISLTNSSLRVHVFKELSSGLLEFVSCATGNLSYFDVGSKYFIRVYRSQSGSAFDLCLTEISSVPENDECATAIPLSVSPNDACSNVVTVDFSNATQNIQSPLPCPDQYSQHDLWYSFVATSDKILLRNSSLSSQLNYSVLNSCVDLSCVANGTINDSSAHVISGLTPGAEYLLSLRLRNALSVSFCLSTVPGFTNDLVANATLLTPSPGLSCELQSASYTGIATPSTSLALSGCAADFNTYLPNGNPNQTQYEDQWFKFVAISDEQLIQVTGLTPTAIQVFSGSPSNLVCAGTLSMNYGSRVLSELTVGTEYYLRIIRIRDTIFNPFSICLMTPLSVPDNDEPINAVEITASPNLDSCQAITGQINRGSNSDQVPDPVCNDAPSDIWYKFTATSPSVQFQLTNTNPDAVFLSYATSLYQSVGENVGQELYCYDPFENVFDLDANAAGYNLWNYQTFFPLMQQNYSGLTIGEQYYIRLYIYSQPNLTYHNVLPMTFEVCLKTLTPVPANSNLQSATPIVISDFDNATYVGGYSTRAPYHVDIPFVAGPTACGELGAISFPSNKASAVYYDFTATQSNHSVKIINDADILSPLSTYIAGEHYPLYISVYEYIGEQLAITHCSTIVENELTLTSLTPGKQYFIKVMYAQFPFVTDFEFQIAVTTVEGLTAADQKSDVFVLYPNPVDDLLQVNWPPNVLLKSAEILSVDGKRFGIFDPGNGTIATSNLPSGIYFLRLDSTNGIDVIKFVKR
ncbi:MAG: T9SS type A sorting domain-containing protein [Flavobacterium sp.]|nr:T9SS type A sorting domain-containing protein [Flavobacterium sp.]